MDGSTAIETLRSALTTIVQLVGGHARSAITISAVTYGVETIYTAVIPGQNRSEVYRFLAKHPQFGSLENQLEPLTLTSNQVAALIRLAYDGTQIAAALE